jgi:hypothetical protein
MAGDWTPVLVLAVIGYFTLELVRTVADNRLRSKLIEKGMTDENAKALFAARPMGEVGSSLKWGMVSIGVGAAFLIGRMPWVPDGSRDEITAGIMFLLAGLGLILYYFIAGVSARNQQN